MIKNYFRIAFRNLIRNKTFSFIIIGGMAVGITAFWLISLYIGDEFSYENQHQNADRIVRVAQHSRWDGGDISQATTSAPFAASLKEEFPEIEQTVRIFREGGGVIKFKEKAILADDIVFADNSIFDVFTYPFEYGDKLSALTKPQSIVLTERLAKKLFKNPKDAINQTVYFDNDYPNLVTGVIKDVPENSHLGFSAVRSLPENFTGDWQNFSCYTYLLLKSADYKQLENKMPVWAKKTIQKRMGIDDYRIELQPLKSIHLHSDLVAEIGSNSSISRVYIFIAIALLILLIAIINYMNLSTARSSIRVKEVGMRKVLGSGQSHLVMMFIMEALLMTIISGLIAFVFVVFLLPAFNDMAGKNLTVWRFGVLKTILVFIGFALITGVMSGSYPAIFLSHFKAIPALKGQMGNQSNNILFRKSLVVFQFIITIMLIAGSIVVYQQMKYVDKKDLGFNKEQVLTFHIHDQNVRAQISSLKNQLLQNSLILNAASCGNPIGNNNIGTHGFKFEKNNGAFATNSTMAEELVVDADYLPTLEIKLKKGRNFTKSSEADKYTAALVNETLVKEMGWKEPIGKRLKFGYGGGEMAERTIIGVVKDFHTFSLQHKVESMVLLMPAYSGMEDNLYVKINTTKTQEALAYINKVYKNFDQKNPLDFHFLDENFAQQYQAEQKQQFLALIFTGLAIFIACLGLFGLAAFSAQQRIKEIGIRKVLGASVSSLALMISNSYIKLVCIAILIATPFTWLSMDKWLQHFAYHITIEWWVFVLAGILAVVIAFATVSFQAIKAALANPIKSLRTE